MYWIPVSGKILVSYNQILMSKQAHKNNNSAIGNFGIYILSIFQELFKFGKSDLDRVTKSSNIPTRIHQQVRKLENEYGKENVAQRIIEELNDVSTKEAKEREKELLQEYYELTGQIPKGNKRSSGFLPEEREWIGKFIDNGFVDTFREFHPEPDRYSWWSYRRQARDRNLGWRIDYNMVTENLKSRLKNADILDQVVHSDHCPITLDIN